DARRRREQAARGPPRRQQRRGGASHPRRGEPPSGDPRRDDGRRCRQGRRARERRRLSPPRVEERTRTMAIFINADSKVIVQGMTGSEGTKHTTRMLASGTAIVGGVNPRKAGTTQTFPLGEGTRDIPVFGTVAEAVETTGANVSVIFVPPAFTKAAVVEAIEAQVPLVVIITEGVPVADTAEFFALAAEKGV